MKQQSKQAAPRRRQPGAGETWFQTRHLRRELLSQMHMLKAARNRTREGAAPLCTVDQILNEALTSGLEQLRRKEPNSWISPI